MIVTLGEMNQVEQNKILNLLDKNAYTHRQFTELAKAQAFIHTLTIYANKNKERYMNVLERDKVAWEGFEKLTEGMSEKEKISLYNAMVFLDKHNKLTFWGKKYVGWGN